MTNQMSPSPTDVLRAKYKESWSGCIEITEETDRSLSWQVYLLHGKLQYITTNKGQQARLNYLWYKYKLGGKCPKLDLKGSEYSQVCRWLEEKKSSQEEAKKILLMFTLEGIVQVLSIRQARIELNPAKRIKKAVINFEIPKFIGSKQIQAQIKGWQNTKKYCLSPLSRLYLEQKNALQFYKLWKEKYNTPELSSLAKVHKLSSFVSLFVTKSTIYEMATKAQVDTYFLLEHLQQSIESEIVTVLPLAELAPDEKPETATPKPEVDDSSNQKQSKSDHSQALIVCIDDSKTVQKQVKMTLQAVGYQFLGITDPTLALKELAQHQPAVILMDINMPNVNGYDLCSLLRKSQKFQEIPIVMLTGRDGMIDRVRAKLVGANDYLTKPCDPNKLIALVKVLEERQPVATTK